MDQVVGQALATWRKRVLADQETVELVSQVKAAG